MRYDRTVSGIFLRRPNRFVAEAEIDGEIRVCHVKNTGRCRELLVPGTEVFLSVSGNPSRKTAYDLIAVRKGERIVNIDSQAPNAVVKESIEDILGHCDRVVPEWTCGDSRFDFYAERGNERIIAEVKGVTLEKDDLALFPDAPTERGLKHVRELTALTREGFSCRVVFLIQMEGIGAFSPNYAMQPEFGEACEKAAEAGVRISAYGCRVTEDSLALGEEVPVRLHS